MSRINQRMLQPGSRIHCLAPVGANGKAWRAPGLDDRSGRIISDQMKAFLRAWWYEIAGYQVEIRVRWREFMAALGVALVQTGAADVVLHIQPV